MKKIFLFLFLCITASVKAQTYPLRTFTDIPDNAYLKDTNNELTEYEGTWTGTWNDRTIFVIFKKNIHIYDDVLKYYKDNLIAKFKVVNNIGNILFDNTNLADDKTKIWGSRIRKIDGKYSLIYNDHDLCDTTGSIYINFTDSTKTKLNWKYNQDSNIITSDCQYYNTVPFPTALPKEIILTKQ